MPTNQLLANAMFTLSAEGVCGASLMALSFALSAPQWDPQRQGRYAVMITNLVTTAPLHVQPRVTYTDARGTSQTATHTLYLASNAQAYGGSALQLHGLLLLPSGAGVTVPLENVAGSVLQVWVLAASNTASATYLSGAAVLWRI